MNAWAGFAREAARALAVDLPDREPTTSERVAWASSFPVAELALDSVGLASAMIDGVGRARDGRLRPPVRLDPDRVAASFGSDRLLRIAGAAPPVWAPLSGFWRAADGWVRTHGNYPHHAERLRYVLGVADDAENGAVARAIASRSRFDLEDAAATAGAIAVAVRSEAEWAQHPQSLALATTPLVGSDTVGGAAPRPWPGGADGGGPLMGIRVLDLTRVIAGPIATRDLALAGADVLRVDDPRLPEIPWQHLDTGQHKRTTLLDLRGRRDRRRFDDLLRDADVLVTGYRPGALDRFGLGADALAETHPGLVVAAVSAWGATGPWAHRRGFDSIVQAATGIAVAEREFHGSASPGALPVQALDHASGHLLAAAVAVALARQRTRGGSPRISIALARTAAELQRRRAGRLSGTPSIDGAEAPTVSLRVDDGTLLTCAPPPLAFDGAPMQYASVHRCGADPPEWER